MKRAAITLLVLLTIQFFVPSQADAITMSRGFSSSTRMSTSVRTSSSRVSSTSARSVRGVKPIAQGGSQAHLYSTAYLMILANQSRAAEDSRPVRDPAALATYGVPATVEGNQLKLVVMLGLFAVAGLVASSFIE